MEEDVESEERYIDDDKVEVESFGFEIPDEVENSEQDEEDELVNLAEQAEDGQLVEEVEQEEQVPDAPTPLQDEPIDVIDEVE